MNYYNPGYMNYPSYPISQFNNMPVTSPTPTLNGLNGKIVDGEDMVRATEVPIGGYGIFPKADLSEIYLKTWNNNGTTNIIKFRPVVEKNNNSNNDNFAQLMQKMNNIESKIDSLKTKEVVNNGF